MGDSAKFEVLDPFHVSDDEHIEAMRAIATFLETCALDGFLLAGTVAVTRLVGSHSPELVSFVREGLLDSAMSVTTVGGVLLTGFHVLMAQDRKIPE